MHLRPHRIVVAACGLLLGACVGVIGDGEVEGRAGDPDDDPATAPDAAVDAPPADFALTVSDRATTELGTRLVESIDVTGDHFVGSVALTASGAPAGWTVSIEPSTVEVTAGDGTPVRATLTVTVPTNATAMPDGTPITITGAGLPGTRAAATTVTVANTFTLAIGQPGAAGQHFAGYANGQLRMKRGARLRIVNTDTIPHRVHSDAGVQGFPHQATSMAAGSAYEVTLGSTGSDLFYCHDHGQGTGEVRLTVE